MRVISGKFGGRVLKENPFDHIRPTTDKVKQAMFTKLQFEIDGSRVLDLFCGTGGLGIEALSRGAKEVIFVDKNYKSVEITKQNLKNLGECANVYKQDALIALEKVSGKFDLIILDPPYKSGLYEKVLQKIFERDLLSEGGTIVCEHANKDDFDYSPFMIYDEKRYGTIKLTYLQKGE